MNRALTAMHLWTVHLVLTGTCLLLAPSPLFELVGLRPPGETVWVRLSGMLLMIMGYYFFQAARSNNREFMRWGVTARMWPIFFLTAFVALNLESAVILAFGVIDVLTGLWTARALRLDEAEGSRRAIVAGRV